MCRLRVPQRQRHEGRSGNRPVVGIRPQVCSRGGGNVNSGTVSRQLSVEMRSGSPYGTDNCPAGMAEPV